MSYIATADIVGRNLWDKESNLRKDGMLLEPTEAHTKLAADSLAWAQDISDADVERNEYLYNIRTCARAGSIDGKLLGYVASIVPAYLRHMEREVARKRENEGRALSKFVGAVGDKLLDIAVTVLAQRDFTSDYGTSTLVTFADDAGNRYKWWSSCGGLSVKVDQDGINYDPLYQGEVRRAELGEKVRIKGTVKKHEEYKGCKETVLTRCDQFFPKAPKVKKPKAKKAAEPTGELPQF